MTAPFCPTPEQQAVIEAQHGTLLVLAAVGSGKTTTLSHRVARALQDGVKAHELLALTFTNRAADHMREALAKAVGARVASQVTLSTFHALCNRILRQHAERAGLPTDFRILDEDDAEELMRELGMDQPRKALYAIHADASAVPLGEASVELWATGGFSPRGDARIYVEALGERGAVDFAGLVLLTRALLLRDADCRALWGDRFSSVLVDEVQDTHLSEYEVLSVLAANARSFCLVGDLDQTIYGWRGSAPQTLLARLDRDFGPVHKLELTANFRATRALLAVADRLAEGLSNRVSHVLAPDGADQGERPTLHAYATEAEEHAAIARSMGARLAAGADARQLAVLVRTNQQVGDVGQAFAEQGVPATTVEQFRFYRRAEIKDALALARLVYDRGDEQAARRVARRLVRGVGERTVRRILDEAATCGLRLADLLNQRAVDEGDPLWGLGTPDVVVLDTETTGIQAGRDEVIEVAAQRLRGGRISPASHDRMAALLKNTQPLAATPPTCWASSSASSARRPSPVTMCASTSPCWRPPAESTACPCTSAWLGTAWMWRDG
jgi:DNA helicase II / ATP-dependent DNA helicase PcrA